MKRTTIKQEIWSADKCERIASSVRPHYHPNPPVGLINNFDDDLPLYGMTQSKNGSILTRPMPLIHEDYEIVCLEIWGDQIRKKSTIIL